MPDPEDKKVFVEVTLCGKCGQVKISNHHTCPPKRKACPQCGTSYVVDAAQSVVCHGCGIDIMTGKPVPIDYLKGLKPIRQPAYDSSPCLKLGPDPKPKRKKKPAIPKGMRKVKFRSIPIRITGDTKRKKKPAKSKAKPRKRKR